MRTASPPAPDVTPTDLDRLGEALGRTIRHRTVAPAGREDGTDVFLALQAELRSTFPGVHAEVFDEAGRPVDPPDGGFLVLRKPWPGMLRGIWGDKARFSSGCDAITGHPKAL